MAFDFVPMGQISKASFALQITATNSDPREHTVVAYNFGVALVSSAIIVTLNAR